MVVSLEFCGSIKHSNNFIDKNMLPRLYFAIAVCLFAALCIGLAFAVNSSVSLQVAGATVLLISLALAYIMHRKKKDMPEIAAILTAAIASALLGINLCLDLS